MSELREIDAYMTVDGKVKHPTSVQLSLTINSFPNVKVNYNVGSDAYTSATNTTVQEQMEDIASRQKKMFKERTEDAVVYVSDGKGNHIQFIGLSAAPGSAYSAQSVDSYNIVLPTYAMVDSLNYMCYSPTVTNSSSEEKPCELESTIPNLIMDISKSIISGFEEDQMELEKKGTSRDLGYRERESQHKINIKIVNNFYTILENSKDSFGWDNVKEILSPQGVPFDEQLCNSIRAQLFTSWGSFLPTIIRISEMFQCVYIPTWETPGKIVSKKKVLEDPEEYEAEIISVKIDTGGISMFPSKYVAMVYTPQSANTSLEQIPSLYIAYPEENMNAGGTALKFSTPPWIPDIMLQALEYGNEEESAEPAFAMFPISSMLTRIKSDVADSNKTGAALLRGVLTEMAKINYIWQSYGISNAMIQVPLDLSVKVGTCYKIKHASTGAKVLTGFVWNVTHTISTGRSNAGTTIIQMSHVFPNK